MAIMSCLMNALKSRRTTVALKMLKGAGSLDIVVRHSSALYISGKYGNKNFSYLTPYLDIDKQLSDVDTLDRNLTSRGFKKKASEYVKLWEFYKLTAEDLNKLEDKIKGITTSMTEWYNKNSPNEETADIEKFRMQLSIARSDYKAMRAILWDLDDTIIEQLLKLPNNLDAKTPLATPLIMKTVGTPRPLDKQNTKCHIETGKRLNLLDYRNPMECYLLNEAVLLELGLLRFAGQILAGNDMLKIAGLDFVRSLVVEASGLDHESFFDSFLLKDDQEPRQMVNQLHLVGSASLISFLAIHAKQLIQSHDFPARYFTTGRQYAPLPENVTPAGLYTHCQSSSVQAFVLVKDNEKDYYDQFDKLVNNVCTLYDSICDHYRVVLKPARQLATAESMRLSFELWSPFFEEYVEVGHISGYETYLSKRLLITYESETGREYPRVISGTVLSVQRFLAHLLERDPTKFTIPEKIAECMPGV